MLRRRFITYIRRKFLRICPYGKSYLDQLVTECISTICIYIALAVVVIGIWNNCFKNITGVYYAESIILAIYLLIMEIPNYKVMQKENQIYQELLIYFSRVKHCYTACHHIANAVLNASDGMCYEIERLAGELYRVLMECDRKEKVRDYILQQRTNRYLKLFLVQAFETSEKGDVILENGTSIFAENVEHLRVELMEELYRRKKRAHEFAGYTFVGCAPFYFMPILKQWGLDFAPELELFYAGMGVLLEVITAVITVVIYRMIGQAKEIVLFAEDEEEKIWDMERFYSLPIIAAQERRLDQANGRFSCKIRYWLLLSGEQKSYGRLILTMLLITCSTYLVAAVFCADTHRREKEIVLHSTDAIETIAPVAREEKKAILAAYILELVEKNKNNQSITEDEIRIQLRERVRLGNKNMEQAAVKEIKDRILKYEAAKGTVSEFILCLIAGVSMGMLPLFQLRFRLHAARSGAINEVRLFQSVILMERHLYGITIMGLLEDMEMFARSFKRILRKGINLYGAGPKAALEQMKKEGGALQKGFEELADAFLSVDEVGISKAFAEVESNRRLLEKMTQLEEEISMERKLDNTDLVAKIPMVLSVGAYFIIPFFIFALQEVTEVFELLEELQL